MAAQRVAAQQVATQHVKWWYSRLSSELRQNNPAHFYHVRTLHYMDTQSFVSGLFAPCIAFGAFVNIQLII